MHLFRGGRILSGDANSVRHAHHRCAARLPTCIGAASHALSWGFTLEPTGDPPMPLSPDQKLESLGFPLDRKLTAGAIYRPVVIDGATAYVSGCVPFDGDKNLVSQGKVRSQVSV